MAAVCEIDGCGVVAVGRCSACGRAMCVSHRALTRRTEGGPIVDLCVSCQNASFAARDREREELNSRIADARSRLVAIAEALGQAGIKPPDKYLHATKTSWIEKSSLSILLGFRSRVVHEVEHPSFQNSKEYRRLMTRFRRVVRDDPGGHRYGWYIGDQRWRVRDDTTDIYKHVDRVLRTYVTANGQLVPHGAVSGQPSEVQSQESLRSEREVQFWNGVADQFAVVAGKYDVREP